MAMQLLFLGTGTSAGIPMIGCHCPVCESQDPCDQRTRASVVVRFMQEDRTWQYLIDTSPDLRLQTVRHRIDHLDAVLYTHAHADHVLGLDELRRYNAVQKAPLDLYAEDDVATALRQMFVYIFDSERNINTSFVANLRMHRIEAGTGFELGPAHWQPLRLMHGNLPIVGFRIEHGGRSLAYCTDVSAIPDTTLEQLEDLDLLVIDGLRQRPHPTHLSIDQALAFVDLLKPRRALLTHIAHDVCHAQVNASLPEGVALAYDGLCMDLA